MIVSMTVGLCACVCFVHFSANHPLPEHLEVCCVCFTTAAINQKTNNQSNQTIKQTIKQTNKQTNKKEMAKILNHPRVYSFLHIPVQAASNRVLYDMRRKYTREEFCQVVDFLRERVPALTIATDFICGFPT